MAKIKRWKIPNDDKDIEQLVLSDVAGRNLIFLWNKETDSKIFT